MHLFSLLTSVVIHVVSKENICIFQLCASLSSAEAPAGYPNKNSNNKKTESAWGRREEEKGLRAFFFLSPSLDATQRGICGGESGCSNLKQKHKAPKRKALSQCWGYVLLFKASNMVVI